MTAFLAILTSRVTGPLMAGLSVILIVLLVGAKMETGRVKADLRAQVAESQRLAKSLSTCQANVAALDGALTRQNEAVEAFKARGDQMATAAEKAASDARRAQREADRSAARLAAFQPGATCEAREANVAALIEGIAR